MRWWLRFRKGRAIRSYLARCPALLRARYGVEPEYSPARIMTTLRRHRLDLRHAEYACAMFSGLEPFVHWMRAGPAVDPDPGVAAPHPYRQAPRRRTAPSRESCVARWFELRREAAERYNDGSPRFLPEPESFEPQWVPLSNERAIGPRALPI